MTRPFSAEDLPHFSGIFILTFKKKNGVFKDYLYVKRQDFISCFVLIDGRISLFVKQFRPIISQYTLEIPMGKIDAGETPRQALLRELREECRLRLEGAPALTVRDAGGIERIIPFARLRIEERGSTYPSPGFSDVRNFRFRVHLETEHGNIEELLDGCSLLSEEIDLEISARPIREPGLLQEACGITRHYLYEHFFDEPLR